MDVQAHFEQVLEKSADGVSLPLEMKRSEAAVRDLRTLVRHSDLEVRDELVLQFDGYIDTVRTAAVDLQRFHVRVGSSVDAVISINRWTVRFMDDLAPAAVAAHGPLGLVSRGAAWLLAPFQPVDRVRVFDERAVIDQYLQHTALVAERIAALIIEAQVLLRLLAQADHYLGLIYDLTTRSSMNLKLRQDALESTLWRLFGANKARLKGLARQLGLLSRVDDQYSSAIAQLSGLVLELEAMQTGLADLRDRVAEPELAAAVGAPIPLAVHIETIQLAVERLQAARARIHAIEDMRVRNAAARRDHDARLLNAHA